MIYIVGLGNPGAKYEDTRHNVGWQALQFWVAAQQLPAPHQSGAVSGALSTGVIAGTEVSVLFPDTYMNNSGVAAAKLVPKDAVEQLIVVYDDVDVPFGAVKVSVGGGAAGHNGIKSVTKEMGTPEYVRVRIGIAPKHFWTGKTVRPSGSKLPTFVLKPFTGAERKQLPAVYERVAAILTCMAEKGVTAAMNAYN